MKVPLIMLVPSSSWLSLMRRLNDGFSLPFSLGESLGHIEGFFLPCFSFIMIWYIFLRLPSTSSPGILCATPAAILFFIFWGAKSPKAL